MYCPKCKQIFEQSSRRFCPTDGVRLKSDGDPGRIKRDAGIFANLTPKIEGLQDLDDTLRNAGKGESMDDFFFEIDDIRSDLADDGDFLNPVETEPAEPDRAKLLPVARKVDPTEIPAGHVDLGDPDRMSGIAADFNVDDPEGFVGQIVKGRYKVTEFFGGDESSLAYLADDQIVDDKKVLVRVLLAEEPDEILGSILAEERISLSHFSHPNIARLIDSGAFTSGTNFLITEYVDALSVGDILNIHGQFGVERTARVIRQGANGLNEAHQEGILHRDLRPENLIIGASDGDAEQTILVNFGASNGKPTERNIAYKAPEVLDGRVATAASDIFSLAVVAYEMLTGRMPFDGESANEIVRSQCSGISADQVDTGQTLPSSAREVLDRALSFNPADRYPKARDFGEALFAALTESLPSETGTVDPTSKQTVPPA